MNFVRIDTIGWLLFAGVLTVITFGIMTVQNGHWTALSIGFACAAVVVGLRSIIWLGRSLLGFFFG